MPMPLNIGVGRALLGRRAFSPSHLAGLAPCVLPALSRSMGRLWQDALKTVPAVADGDLVRVATCPFTGADYIAPSDAARPTLKDAGGGKWYLEGDGVNDVLTCGTFYGASGDFSGSFGAAVASPANSLSEIGAFGTVLGGFGLYFSAGVPKVAYGGGNNVEFGTYDTSDQRFIVTKSPGNINATTALWKNGASVAMGAASSGTPNLTAAALSCPSIPGLDYYAGRIYGYVPVAATLTAAQVALLDAYLRGLMP